MNIYQVREHWKKRRQELMESMARGMNQENYWTHVGQCKAIGEFDNFLKELEKNAD